MHPLYAFYSNRMLKDTDEISPDKTYVAEDQDVTNLVVAVRRILSYRDSIEKAKTNFTPMISKPIVPVEVKIVGILDHIQKKTHASLSELLDDSVSLPDMIAIFIGILELIKVGRITIVEDDDKVDSLEGINTRFIINENYTETEELSDGQADGTN
jgi:chromatin segregation and condensation protein Rec8/ScpA/Scc1 (kleisin family)